MKEDNISFIEAWEDEEYKEAIVDEMLIKLGYVLEPKYLFPNMLELIRKDEFSIDFFEEAINSIIASTQGQDSENDFDGLFEDMDLKSSKLGGTGPSVRGWFACGASAMPQFSQNTASLGFCV